MDNSYCHGTEVVLDEFKQYKYGSQQQQQQQQQQNPRKEKFQSLGVSFP
jgi:hypothetical protein